ncbi:MAG: sterol desaturase family protein [Flavobacteriales bacterium]|nr:sterol desaturase family protein [Flavobacteriales bacterium]
MTTFFLLTGIVVVLFLVILGYEIVVSIQTGVHVFNLSDALVNTYCAILERSFDVFYGVLFLIGAQYIYEHIAPFQMPINAFTWILGIVLFDFVAYWFHRLSHEINFLWAAHIVHHQSEELNFTTVFRVSFFAVIFRSFFFIWFPFLGYDALSIVTFGVFLGFYQLVTHSRLVGRLGFLEEIFTTPSHHRVHHARNVKYMDHNYGHILIIWDKMFGTFVREDEEPDYGITSGFESNSAFRAQFAYWKDLFTRASRTKSLSNKMNVFLKGPAWTPEDVGFLPSEYQVDEQGQRMKREVRLSFEYGAYLLIGTLVTLTLFAHLTFTGKSIQEPTLALIFGNQEIIALTVAMLLSVFAHGQMLEYTRLAFPAEVLRLIALPLIVFQFMSEAPTASWLVPLTVGYCGISMLWLIRVAFFTKNNIRRTPSPA